MKNRILGFLKMENGVIYREVKLKERNMKIKDKISRNPKVVVTLLGSTEYENSENRDLLDALLTLALHAVEGNEGNLKEFYEYYDQIFDKIKDDVINPL